jgi:uncharacterized protein YndB with AHSA1/START domain
MLTADHEVTIRRSVEDVFAFVASGENHARWRPAVLDVVHVFGYGVGTTYYQCVKGPFGRRVAADYEVTEYEPARRIGFRVTAGPVRPRGRVEFTPADGGTRVRFALEWELKGPKRLMAPLVTKRMRAEVQNLERLRDVLEQHGCGE